MGFDAPRKSCCARCSMWLRAKKARLVRRQSAALLIGCVFQDVGVMREQQLE